jgi:alpha-L-arabinofuranosidase
MYAPHQGATALRARIESPDIHFTKSNIVQTSWQSALQKGETMKGSILLVSGSASIKDKKLFLTITNSHAHEAVTVKIDIPGGVKVNEARRQILTGEIHTHNTFSSPTLLTPQVFDVSCGSSQLNLSLHPASVAAITLVIS